MKAGLQIPSFTWPGGDAGIGPTFARVVQTADEVGFDSIWVMDHFFQIRGLGPAEEPMLEGWEALAFAAALTRRARLGLMVGGVHYRQAGLWAKAATTLDVLSGGRAYLGIGAAWNEEESHALGFPMPPLRDRFEMLEEALQIVHGMWEGERGSGARFEGVHYQADRLLNSPQALQRPHPPILIGGGGERKTLRLVAQYADATNVFGGPELIRHKYAVLRAHCQEVGRDYDTIERTNLQSIDPVARAPAAPSGGPGHGMSRPETPTQVVDRFGALAEAGAQHVIFSVKGVHDLSKLELIGREILPELHRLG